MIRPARIEIGTQTTILLLHFIGISIIQGSLVDSHRSDIISVPLFLFPQKVNS